MSEAFVCDAVRTPIGRYAGGVESMSRAPFVMPKAESAYSRSKAIYDTTIGWRFVNPRMKALYGVDSMPETGENVAGDFGISRADQDSFALASQRKAAARRRRAILPRRSCRSRSPTGRGVKRSSTRTNIPARIPRSRRSRG